MHRSYYLGRGHKFTDEVVPDSVEKEGTDLEGKEGGCAEMEKDIKDQHVPSCLTVAREGIRAAVWSFWNAGESSDPVSPGCPLSQAEHLDLGPLKGTVAISAMARGDLWPHR